MQENLGWKVLALFIPSDFRIRVAYILGIKRRLVIRYGGGSYNAYYNDLDVRLAKETISLRINEKFFKSTFVGEKIKCPLT